MSGGPQTTAAPRTSDGDLPQGIRSFGEVCAGADRCIRTFCLGVGHQRHLDLPTRPACNLPGAYVRHTSPDGLKRIRWWIVVGFVGMGFGLWV